MAIISNCLMVLVVLLGVCVTWFTTHTITQTLSHAPVAPPNPSTSTLFTTPATPTPHFSILSFIDRVASWRPGPTPISLPWPIFTVGIRIVDYLHSLVLMMAPTQIVLLWHASGFVKTGAIHAAAQLGIADALAQGPLTIDEIANITDSHGPALLRLLRALETLHTFSELSDGRWCNTVLSEYMRHDHPQSMRQAVIMFGQEQFVAFSKLDHTIQTGEPAFQHVYGQDFWAYHRQNKVAATIFDGSMTSLSAMVDTCIAEDIDFSSYSHIVDVAGGHGSLLQQMMARYPHLHGILFDQPTVISRASTDWYHSPFINRSTLISGDLFQPRSYPKAEAYIIKQTLHDFSDGDAITILSNIHSSYTRADGKLLIVERMMRKGVSFIQSQGTAFADLLMMSNFGRGRERYLEDFIHLLESSGFQFIQVHPTRTVYFVIEAQRMSQPTKQHTSNIPKVTFQPIADPISTQPSTTDIPTDTDSGSSTVPPLRYPPHTSHHTQEQSHGEFIPTSTESTPTSSESTSPV